MQANRHGYSQHTEITPGFHFHRVYPMLAYSLNCRVGLYSRNVSDLVLILHHIHDLVRQNTRHLSRICAWNTAIQSQPLRDPRLCWLLQCDDALEDLRCAFTDCFSVAAEVKEVVAVWASLFDKVLR